MVAHPVGACAKGALNSVDLIASDMTLPHEALPSGVPDSYDWQTAPRLGYGNRAPDGWTSFIAWGQVYQAVGGSPAPNTRVELRNIAAWVFDLQTNSWTGLQAETLVEGAAYVEDFADNASRPADIRAEPGGGLSVRLADGYNFHFWPASGRVPVPQRPIGGVFTTVEARLIADDPASPDDRAEARLLLAMGADYWRAADAEWQPDWSTVGDVAIGRFRFVTEDWQSFNMTTASAALLCAHPPPLR
jgi:hypothetical protein